MSVDPRYSGRLMSATMLGRDWRRVHKQRVGTVCFETECARIFRSDINIVEEKQFEACVRSSDS